MFGLILTFWDNLCQSLNFNYCKNLRSYSRHSAKMLLSPWYQKSIKAVKKTREKEVTNLLTKNTMTQLFSGLKFLPLNFGCSRNISPLGGAALLQIVKFSEFQRQKSRTLHMIMDTEKTPNCQASNCSLKAYDSINMVAYELSNYNKNHTVCLLLFHPKQCSGV